VFFDVGANIGFWSLFLAHKFPTSKIISIEANPNTAAIFRKNVEINDYKNIELIEVGVGPERGQFDLYLNTTGNRGGDSFVSDGSRPHKISVDVERMSDLIRKSGADKIEFMKIDVEGMEEGVFSDICVETLHSPGIVALLRGHGYQIVLRARENSIFSLADAA
jgi:FkbM family methyltransferase